jgi:uncharacterized protein (TIGR02646 family)
MIRVVRPAAPRALTRNAQRWKATLLAALGRLATNKNKRAAHAVHLAREKYRHAEVKEVLVRLFHGKCAYCESKVTHVEYGHIEHYRPKSCFPEFTFEWGNLLLACGICNGAEHKGDHFPEVADRGPLINPCEDDPSQHLHFHFDVGAGLASVYGRTARGRTTTKLLGLNRPDLRAFRSRCLKQLAALARLAATNPEAAQLLSEARQDDAPYAAFARGLR